MVRSGFARLEPETKRNYTTDCCVIFDFLWSSGKNRAETRTVARIDPIAMLRPADLILVESIVVEVAAVAAWSGRSFLHALHIRRVRPELM